GQPAEGADDRQQAVERALLPDQRLLVAPREQADGVVEGGQRQLLLAGEVVVDAALLQPGLADQVAQRRAEVAARVEDRRRALDDHPPGPLALAHVSQPST